tara:strand:+ start:702 stop:1094 length:393 start_codon:yes stop_codon:yes gene_type:complete
MKRELIFTKKKSDEIYRLPHEELKELDGLVEILKTNYDFQIGYVPDGYNVALLMQKDDKEDSRKDEWVGVFFNKSIAFGNNGGTITLDNMDEMDEEGEERFDITKVVDGNFENIINMAIELIKKYRDSNQ